MDKDKEKKLKNVSNKKYFKDSMKIIESTVKKLEENLKDSNDNDKQLLTNLRVDKMKHQGLFNQLEEAKKENKQLLNILQQRCGEQDLSKRSSQIDVSSCSTISMVNLQYKYEELLASHNGLLKILDMRISEIQKVQAENERLKSEIDVLSAKLSSYDRQMKTWNDKVRCIKDKKNNKIRKIKNERDTLRVVHNQLVDLLQKQCMEKDIFLTHHMKNCKNSNKTLLLQEVRKNNLLAYENFKLKQELQYFRSISEYSLHVSSSSSKTSTNSNTSCKS